RWRRLSKTPLGDLMALFERWVPLPDGFGGGERDTPYAPVRAFWLFLGQVLSADGGCQEAVHRLAVWWAAVKGKSLSSDTGAYCKARARLPQKALDALQAPVVQAIGAGVPEAQRLWRGRRVKVVDGSSVSAPDTADNQAAFPQPAGQKEGCGFPCLRLVAIFDLMTGLWLEAAVGSLRVAEQTLLHRL